MSRDEIIEKLSLIFRDVFDDDSIELSDSTSADDIEEWDSLSHITLLFEVESVFGFKFSMSDLSSMKNVGDMVVRIEELA